MDKEKEDKTEEQEPRPAKGESQPAAEENQAVAEEAKAVAEDERVATEEEKSVAEDDKPDTEEEQAAVKENQAVAEEAKAVAEDDKPAVEEEEAVADESQMVAEDDKLDTEEEQAAVKENQAVEDDSQPVAEENQAVEDDSQPVAEENQAVEEDDKTAVEEEQSSVEESQPSAEESQAVVEEDKPTVEEGQAVAEYNQPATEDERLVAEEKQSAIEESQAVAEESEPVAEKSHPIAALSETVEKLKAVKETIKIMIKGLRRQLRPSLIQVLSRTISNSRDLIILNIIVIGAITGYILLRPGPKSTAAQTTIQEVSKQVQVEKTSAAKQTLQDKVLQEKATVVLEQGISWRLAEQLYNARQYKQAYEVFRQLCANLNTNRPGDEYIRDFMHLKMAMCLQQAEGQADFNEHLTVALQSRSPAVRALANYSLIFTENRKREYLSARMHAYRTLALLKTAKDAMPESFEADCYFMMAESLTRQILLLSNDDESLPGKFWSDTLLVESIPEMGKEELWSLLQKGIEELNDAVLAPEVKKHTHLSVGLRWSAVCKEAPLEELLARFASAAEMNIEWEMNTVQGRVKPTTVFLPTSSEQAIAEVAAGSIGLVAQLDDKSIHVHNPNIYDNLNEHKELLVREAISAWRRFLLRYHGDYRTPNAHFALGLLQEHGGQTLAALGEYKLLSSHYAQNPLAPFALLNASKLKTNMLDYTGASKDLTELIIQYPACKVADEASLYLAEATMWAGLYDEAIKMFRKVYNLDINADSQKQATFGLGKCFFETKNYEGAKKWLSQAIKLIDNSVDERFCPAYFMLGKAEIELGNYEQASASLRKALKGLESKEEYIRIILYLVKTETGQQNYVTALNILENVPVSQLSQEYACEVLITKAQIFREIGITDTAISLLRRKIEFIADSNLRARLSFALAKCYYHTGDLRIARKEVTDAIADLPAGPIAQEAKLFLADIAIQLAEYEQARQVCLLFLNEAGYDEQNRKEALELLGKAYANMDKFDKAALAYAGIYDKTKVGVK